MSRIMHCLWRLRKLTVSLRMHEVWVFFQVLKRNRTLCACAEQYSFLLNQTWLLSEQPKVIELSKIMMAVGLHVSDCSLLRNTQLFCSNLKTCQFCSAKSSSLHSCLINPNRKAPFSQVFTVAAIFSQKRRAILSF